MTHASGLPSEIDITLKQYSVRDLAFSVTQDNIAYDASTDDWRFRVVASDGTVLFNVTQTGMTRIYSVGPPITMVITVTGFYELTKTECKSGYYELRNVTLDLVHAEGRFEVRPSISEDL